MPHNFNELIDGSVKYLKEGVSNSFLIFKLVVASMFQIIMMVTEGVKLKLGRL